MADKTDVFEQDIKQVNPPADPNEQLLIQRLFKYTTPEYMPYQLDYLQIVKECYNFKELKQWQELDMQALAKIDIPTLPVDRIGRSLDTINGIRENTGSKKKINKSKIGDSRLANMFDKLADNDDDKADYKTSRNDAFNGMLDCGMGVRKIGFDPTEDGGSGRIFAEYCEIEDIGFSRCKKRTLEDIVWGWHRTMMNWEDAMMIAPEKAGIIKGLKTTLEAKWESLKAGETKGSIVTRDYQGAANTTSEGRYRYPDQVFIYEFWLKRIIPYKKIGFLQQQVVNDGQGNILPISIPQVREEAIDYQEQEGEQKLAVATKIEWHQYIVARGEGELDSVLIKEDTAEDHPFVGMCSERRKNGQPMGFIERAIPHQKRINIAWAQKVAYNNKSIKSPLIVKGNIDLQTAIQQSSFGAILQLDHTSDIVSLNTQPQVNLQAIEEGNMARQDMDFSAAASEPVLRGQVGGTNSGIQMSMQQNSAITPLNKWIKAEQESEKYFWYKWACLAIKFYRPERIMSVLGQEEFAKLMQPLVDQQTGQVIAPPLQFPLQHDITHYEITIQDQSLSDFNKQQTFNAVMAMKGSGILFEDQFVIESAPIKNSDEALKSNQDARFDLMRQMQQQMDMMGQQIQFLAKNQAKPEAGKPAPKTSNQHANAVQGKQAPQNRQSMLGGMGINNPVAMG